MAYTLQEIRDNFIDFAQEYIMLYLDRKTVQGAYRNEYCSDSALLHILNNTPRYEMTAKILEKMEIDSQGRKVWLNSNKTHAVNFSAIEKFYSETLSLEGGGYNLAIDEDCFPPNSDSVEFFEERLGEFVE
jgi:hypothetical protein